MYVVQFSSCFKTLSLSNFHYNLKQRKNQSWTYSLEQFEPNLKFKKNHDISNVIIKNENLSSVNVVIMFWVKVKNRILPTRRPTHHQHTTVMLANTLPTCWLTHYRHVLGDALVGSDSLLYRVFNIIRWHSWV